MIELPVPPLLHVNVAPASPDAVNNELPQLFCTDTEGAPGMVFGAAVAMIDGADVQPFTLCVAVKSPAATVMELPVPPLLHENVAPEAPVAVSSELPQLSVTETVGAEGMELTVNTAALDVAVPAIFVHTARYCLLLSAVVVVNDNVLLVAPPILFHELPLLVLCCHCTVGAGPPLAPELNVTLSPAHHVCEDGCVVTWGATVLPSTATVTTTFCVLVHSLVVNV